MTGRLQIRTTGVFAPLLEEVEMTPGAAACWMLDQLSKRKYLDQEIVAWELHQLRKDLTYENDSGNLAISKAVLAEFSKLTKGDEVVWSRSERQWRYRERADKPGRMQY